MVEISNSISDTEKLAKKLTGKIKAGDVVLLRGDLGAGKTAFVKAFVKALGGDYNAVTSPTFTIINEYRLKDFNIYHFDLYRIENENELANLGIEEYFYSNSICFVEWPERAFDMMPAHSKTITIEKLSNTKRKFTFEE